MSAHPIAVYGTRTALAAAPTVSGDCAYLREPGREGLFVFDSSNLSARVTADPLQGIVVPPASASTGASGAWVRQWDGINGYPEWFYSGNWADAIEGCYRLCAVTQLGRKDYFITRTVKLQTPWRKIIGQGGIAYNGQQGTRIVGGFASGDIMQIGFDANPGGNPGVTFLRGNTLNGFQLTRGAQLVPAGSIAASPTGLRCQYLYDCDVAVYAFENSVGMQIKGCVTSRLSCYAERALAAASVTNDVAIGIYIDGTENIGLAGGNASIFVKAVTNMAVTSAPIRTGVYGYGKLADLTLDHCETVSGRIAIHLKATGIAANNVDIRLLALTMDQPAVKGLLLEDFAPGSQIDIISPYCGLSATGTHGIDIINCQADINIIGGQLICVGDGAAYGIRALNSKGVNVSGTSVLDFPNPVFLDGSSGEIKANISNPNTTAGAYAVGLSSNCSGSKIDCKITGKAIAFPAAGVVSYSDITADVRILTERIDAVSCSGGRKVMLGAGNVSIIVSGRYLGNGTPSAAGSITVEGLPAGDVLLPSAKVLKVGGNQVVGARQPAIANDASGAVNQAKINSILAALRAHGLIGS